MDAESLVLGEGKATMELRRIDPRRGLWVVTGGTIGIAGDIVRVPSMRDFGPGEARTEITPFDVETVVDAVTGAVLLPESGEPREMFGRTMRIVRLLEEAGLPQQAQIVRDWLRGNWDEDLRDRLAA